MSSIYDIFEGEHIHSFIEIFKYPEQLRVLKSNNGIIYDTVRVVVNAEGAIWQPGKVNLCFKSPIPQSDQNHMPASFEIDSLQRKNSSTLPVRCEKKRQNLISSAFF